MESLFINIGIAIGGFYLIQIMLKFHFSNKKEKNNLKTEYNDLLTNPKYKVTRKII